MVVCLLRNVQQRDCITEWGYEMIRKVICCSVLLAVMPLGANSFFQEPLFKQGQFTCRVWRHRTGLQYGQHIAVIEGPCRGREQGSDDEKTVWNYLVSKIGEKHVAWINSHLHEPLINEEGYCRRGPVISKDRQVAIKRQKDTISEILFVETWHCPFVAGLVCAGYVAKMGAGFITDLCTGRLSQ